ncbi:stress-induced protein KIN2-like [Juglans regia]|uniref:Stress-induced protein KIN2-like n=1 Tax=Juglans regia TaxID=51240 RepID=A0A2I4FT42_JUGRE|nr:stress-induced protein KIN2-like [Juglans regia]
MADNSQNLSFQAGETKGQAQEKASNMMDGVANVAQSAKESIQETGTQMKDKAQGAAGSVKNATGMNK